MPNFTMPIGSVVAAVTVCQVAGQISTNTRKWQLTQLTGASTFQSADFLNQYDLDMSLLMIPPLSNSATYYGTMLYLKNPLTTAPRPDTISINTGPGTGGVGLMPTQACGIISFYTNLLGKQGQGRMYVPFPSPDSLSVDGSPTIGYQNDLDTLGNFLRTDIILTPPGLSARFAPVMYQGGVAPSLFITSMKSHNAFATQRRRGAFGKTNSLPF